jgi:hypothetical protein
MLSYVLYLFSCFVVFFRVEGTKLFSNICEYAIWCYDVCEKEDLDLRGGTCGSFPRINSCY